MKYKDYLDKYFGGVAADMARFWGKESQEVMRWKNLTFYVVDGDHIKASDKNIRKVKK